MKTWLTVVVVAGLLAAGSSGASAQMPLPLGAVAPNFTKTQLGGGSVSLSNYSGKVVLLFLLGYS